MPFGVVGIEQSVTGCPVDDRRQLPRQVVGALNCDVRPARLERRHGVSTVTDEKYIAAAELVSDQLMWLPRGDVGDADIDGLTDCCNQQVSTVLLGKRGRCVTVLRKVRGDEDGEVTVGGNEYSRHI